MANAMMNAFPVSHHPAQLSGLLANEFTNARLTRLLGVEGHRVPLRVWCRALFDPLIDLLSRPGRELRARVVRTAWELAGEKTVPPVELPLIVELLHAGSLMIDDMDGSANRRGAAALHGRYGMPIAVNAGNWLYFWAQELVGKLSLSPEAELTARRAIGETLLAYHYGQALDVSTKITSLAQREVPDIVFAATCLKTGKLFGLSATLGALAAGAPESVMHSLTEFGRELGIILQMLDDSAALFNEERHHEAHEDIVLSRVTWPWAWLASELDQISFRKLKRLAEQARTGDADAQHVTERMRTYLGPDPKRHVRGRVAALRAKLHAVSHERPALRDIEDELTILENTYR